MTTVRRLATSLGLLPALALALALSVTACTSSDERPRQRVTQLPEPGDAVGEDLMIALAQAKNFHHKAKVYLSDGKIADAIASVRQILAISFPDDAPEGEDVRLDARALLAKLLVDQGKVDEAMTVVEEGITGARRHSFFLANLWTVKGEVYEAQAALLEANPAAAADAKRNAIRAYDESIKINTELQKRLLQERN